MAAKATGVQFSKPVDLYLQNFLHFPVGGAVPTGYYDRTKGRWVPTPNGRVIGILSITGGMVDLDVDGKGQPATAAKLATLGITDAERTQLAGLYKPGQSVWRVPLRHFSPFDT